MSTLGMSNCLIDWSERTPEECGIKVKIIGSLLIQHTVSRWCSSGCVNKGCGGVNRWLQTADQLPKILFYRQPGRQSGTASTGHAQTH
jgi:hypothetical protein